jgi:hypothetical protein
LVAGSRYEVAGTGDTRHMIIAPSTTSNPCLSFREEKFNRWPNSFLLNDKNGWNDSIRVIRENPQFQMPYFLVLIE